jgi:hypothetical protein
MRRNSMILGRIRWAALSVFVTVIALLSVAAGGAQAVVVNDNGDVAGVALSPNGRLPANAVAANLNAAGASVLTSSGSCNDPAASTEQDILTAGSWPLSAPISPICWHGGPVMHANETYTLAWEGQAPYTYWSGTKNYVHNFLSDVAASSGTLVNPYSDTTQYWDNSPTKANDPNSARAAYDSIYGGGCDDNGTAACQFGSTTGSGPGNSLPSQGACVNQGGSPPVPGDDVYGGSGGGGSFMTVGNTNCVTDAQIQTEVTNLIDNDGLISHTKPGYTPLVNVLTPPGVVVCLDQSQHLCSANANITPPPPSLSTSPGTGSIPAGTWEVEITYMTANGEQVPSAPQSITTTGSGSSITISSPPLETGVTGWYAYMTQANSTTYSRQTSSTNTQLNPIGTAMTVNAFSSGQSPPATPALFCSYHGQVTDPQSGQHVAYVVQPWVPFTACDDPDVPPMPQNPTPPVMEKGAGQRLASPLSQADMAAIVNPQLNGWFGLDGMEIQDQNECQGLGQGLDTFNFGSGGPYYLQREFNNTSVVDSDPYTYFGCLPNDVLLPAFVAPSAVNQGDTVDFDGSDTGSSLAIPNANYQWSFGDGTTGAGPSVEHSYSKGGNYTVTLTVTDRGGNQATLSEPVQVLGATGLPVPQPIGSNPNLPSKSTPALMVHLLLLPQALRSVLKSGISLRVNSTESANGFADISIARKVAKRLHIRTGNKPFVVIGTGTVSQVRSGTVTLHLRLSSSVVKKLKHLKHVNLSVHLSLVDSYGRHIGADVAGSY